MPTFNQRTLAWLVLAIVLGTIVLPIAVYYTGVTVLGPYSKGGLPQFMGNFLTDLLHLRWSAVVLALGPATIAAVFLAVTGAFRR